ncbi:YjeF N-terminal domain-containing protein [Phlyctochytrium arcticum]|nr:YjeF N-terminal domain-containing protein [Phlyctochytrium arcticum]
MATLKYLGQKAAQTLDQELMDPARGGFSIDQLMELAGLSVASAIAHEYSPEKASKVLLVAGKHPLSSTNSLDKNVTCGIGPGNNGGDALVAARHLAHFGYTPTVYYPKRTDKPLFKNLITQIHGMHIPVLDDSDKFEEELMRANLVVDGIFGFGFSGNVRTPFDKILNLLKEKETHVPIVAIDVPSGWDVEKGNASGQGLNPAMLVSLTAPKPCAEKFAGVHYLGGRFLPPDIAEQYGLSSLLELYKGTSQCVRL